ncbi:hypothetical protein OS493_002023 [Desmophyllum pertusum]|uniref:BEN domain-containing protein n=1 Tax=Desmophyllum pertusum TaxID=174260 RepID=A0A9W9Z5E1_9CNID|nr:hypothetical protein OS493_002023 [Desmophyllum pertusum]
MACSERLQMQKLKENCGNDEQFALVLFVEEEKYSVIHKGRIQEDHYAYDQVVHVLWGKGKTAQHYPARLISCGTKDDCEKEAMDLSFPVGENLHVDDNDGSSDVEIQEEVRNGKRKGNENNTQVHVPSKKSKETSKSASAPWQVGFDEEEKKLKQAMEINSQQELLRAFLGGVPMQDLSSIVNRLNSIESKVDRLLKQAWSQTKPARPPTCTSVSPSSSRESSTTGSSTSKEKNDIKGVDSGDEVEESEMMYNGINLLSLKAPAREPTRYATRLAGVLFSKEEFINGMIPPLNAKYARVPLDAEKISLMRSCIAQQYSTKVANKYWSDIRRAVNQKCNDIRKKMYLLKMYMKSHRCNYQYLKIHYSAEVVNEYNVLE